MNISSLYKQTHYHCPICNCNSSSILQIDYNEFTKFSCNHFILASNTNAFIINDIYYFFYPHNSITLRSPNTFYLFSLNEDFTPLTSQIPFHINTNSLKDAYFKLLKIVTLQ